MAAIGFFEAAGEAVRYDWLRWLYRVPHDRNCPIVHADWYSSVPCRSLPSDIRGLPGAPARSNHFVKCWNTGARMETHYRNPVGLTYLD